MKRSPADDCFYIGRRQDEDIYLLLYVDDGLVISKSRSILDSFLKDLMNAFEIRINEPRYFVGFEIERNRAEKALRIHQSEYISKLLDRFKMNDTKDLSVPVDPNVRYSKAMCPVTDEEEKKMKSKPYSELLGCLQFLVNLTRPDIAFGVNMLSRFKSNPGEQHWGAAKKILRYLKKTADVGIIYRPLSCKNNFNSLIAYSDADWAGDQDDRKSTSAYVMMYGNGPITWASRKQGVNALSTLESEYMAAANAIQEVKWLRRLLASIDRSNEESVLLRCDNQGMIKYSASTEQHGRTKHIDNKYHFVKDEIEEGRVIMEYVPTDEQLADPLTKALPKGLFIKFRDLLGLGSSLSSGSVVVNDRLVPSID